MDTGDARYLSLQTFSGKIKKIQKSEFTELFERGEYYPPEGAMIFSSDDSSTFFVYGGARNSKPGHWSMSDRLFQIDTKPVLPQDKTKENSASEVVGFKMYNHSQSRSSQFLKLFGASGVTDACGEDFLAGFTINGKNLDCPDENSFITNEIQILEVASETTFRSVIIRSGENNIVIDNLKAPEVFQDGDIPIPSYGSSMIRIPELDIDSKKVALKLGGAVLSSRNQTDVEFLFSSKPMWEEVSSNEVHLLHYNIVERVFNWKKIVVDDLQPRAFHSAAKLGQFIYVFGGLNIETKERYPANPIRININDWTVSEVVVSGLGGHLSGAGLANIANHIYLVGGYVDKKAAKDDKPVDTIRQISISEGKVIKTCK